MTTAVSQWLSRVVSRVSANPAFTKPGCLVAIIAVEQRGKQLKYLVWLGLSQHQVSICFCYRPYGNSTCESVHLLALWPRWADWPVRIDFLECLGFYLELPSHTAGSAVCELIWSVEA